MATFAQIRAERQRALAAVKRAQRVLDSKIEILERQLIRMRRRKTVLVPADLYFVSRYYNDFLKELPNFEKALADLYTIVSA